MTSPVAPSPAVGSPAEDTEGGGVGVGAGTVAAVLAAAEAAIAAYVLAAYTRWLASVITAVLGGFLRFGIAPDPGAIWSAVPLWERQIEGLIERLGLIARAGWINAANQLGVDLPFDPQDPILVDQLQRTRNLLVRTPDEVYQQIINVLGEAVAAGGTVEDQVRGVRHVLDVTGTENWPARARTVAVTEVHRTWNFGALAASMRIQRREATVTVFKTWDAKDDSRTRPAHDRADGQTVSIYQPFIVNMEPLMMPGDPSGSPSNVINCIPGDARISVTGIQKGFRYPYSGSMLSITRKQGAVSSVSPNHPILTERGWILARQLKQGDNLVCTGNLLPSLEIDPDIERVPPSAEQIYNALVLTGIRERMIGLPVDFHGDGPKGDIDVVLNGGKLPKGIEVELPELFDQLCFTYANAPDASVGALDQLLHASGLSEKGCMSFVDLIEALLRAHGIPLHDLCRTAPTNGDAQGFQSGNQGGPRDSGQGGQEVRGSPIQVFLDEVIDIQDFFFEGHLFTFETKSGVYVADGIVSHNCRCKPQFSRRES